MSTAASPLPMYPLPEGPASITAHIAGSGCAVFSCLRDSDAPRAPTALQLFPSRPRVTRCSGDVVLDAGIARSLQSIGSVE